MVVGFTAMYSSCAGDTIRLKIHGRGVYKINSSAGMTITGYSQSWDWAPTYPPEDKLNLYLGCSNEVGYTIHQGGW